MLLLGHAFGALAAVPLAGARTMRETRVRKAVEYNEQALLKQSQPQPEHDDDEAFEPAPKRTRAPAGSAGRARRKSGEPSASGARGPRKPEEEDEAEADDAGLDGHDVDQLDPAESPPGTDNAIYRARAPSARAQWAVRMACGEPALCAPRHRPWSRAWHASYKA